MAFDLGEMLKNVSGLDTSEEERIQKIRLDLIDDDPGNFYQLTGVEELADNIATCGLMDPIRVRQNPDDPDRYVIVSGHRRRAAVTLLAQDDPDKWASIACIVDSSEVSPALQQLRLIYANANTRVLSSAELNTQVQQVEQLLYKLKEEGYDFPGRMRDHVAEACQVSKTKLARLKVIRENLFSDWQPSYQAGKLPESTAYTLAQMPPEWQHCIHSGWIGKDLKYFYDSTAKSYSEAFKRLDSIKCQSTKGSCGHVGTMRRHIVETNRVFVPDCTGCCLNCADLRTCKAACAMAQEKKQMLKDKLKAEKAHEKLKKEEEDRPVIQYIQGVYTRVGQLRQDKNISAQRLFEVGHRYFPADGENEEIALELGAKNIDRYQSLPFGNCFTPCNGEAICAVADLLGCSVDYLLGRTDDPIWPPDVSSESTSAPATPGMWHYDYPPEPGCYIMMYEYKYSGETDITMSKWDGADWDEFDHFDDERFLCWAYEPPREPGAANSADVGWQTGDPSEVGTYIVICKYHPTAPEAVEQVFWNGDEWDHDYINEDVQILKWIRKPEEEAK